ncbi:MAG: 3-phosphoshikimate 1-carboxyvinyltransferase [Bacilli bacterium]|nr:3-phosphoshikimate 1-carboxyvinyltransferase [Bacilli bacterium]
MKVHLAKTIYEGAITAPPSKSFSHRYLVTGALSESSRISHVGDSIDISSTLDCLSAFGCSYTKRGNSVLFGPIKQGNPVFPCGESGTTLRFFVPLAATKFPEAHFLGSKRLISRGIAAYQESLNCLSFEIKEEEIISHGMLVPGKYRMSGRQSSQFFSGLILALPLLDGDSELEVVGPFASEPYVRMTLQAMDAFGVHLQRTDSTFYIPGNQKYQGVSATVEGDFSNSAFLDAMNYLGGDVRISGLRASSSQGDKAYRKIFPVLAEETTAVNIANCIDLGPVLFVFAALHHGAVFTGISRLSDHEGNRAAMLSEELRKAGVAVSTGRDYIGIGRYDGIEHLDFDCHHDHRIAMALSLFSTQTDISIKGVECVSKSFPDYWKTLEVLGAKIIYEE